MFIVTEIEMTNKTQINIVISLLMFIGRIFSIRFNMPLSCIILCSVKIKIDKEKQVGTWVKKKRDYYSREDVQQKGNLDWWTEQTCI